jgi:uncharacterized membrane protein
MLPSQAISDAQIGAPIVTPTVGNSTRAAFAALLFGVLGVLLGAGIFLISVDFVYALRISSFYVGLSLAGICGLSAILVGLVGLHRSRRTQPNSMLGITVARTAIWLGSIELGLAILSAVVLYALRDFHM